MHSKSKPHDPHTVIDGTYEMEHETILFYGASFGNEVVVIKPHNYLACLDFAVIYKTLVENNQMEPAQLHDTIVKLREERNHGR